MNRVKVVNEPSELVPVLMAVDTPVKRDVLKEISTEWRTADEIEKKFGKEGRDALVLFEKMKLVDTKWQSDDKSPDKTFKTYHTFYSSFHINTSCPVL